MVYCEICKKEFKQITRGHLRCAHGLSIKEYKDRYPSSQLCSVETIAAHSTAMRQRVVDGKHFVPFRDIDGFAQKVHNEHKEGPVEYKCIRCGKVKKANRYVAERRSFCSNKCHSLHIKEHPDLYVERNQAISRGTTGVPKKGGYSRCRGGFRKDLGHYVRSRWEADICRIFKYHGKAYDYESYTIRLDDNGRNLTWIVDLVDPNKFMSNGLIEVKGWWDKKSKKKLELLRIQRPDIYNRMTFIEVADMKKLIVKYSKLIPGWETDR